MTTEFNRPDFDRLFGSGQTFDLKTELKWLTETNNWLSNQRSSLKTSGVDVSGPLVKSDDFEKTLKDFLPSLSERVVSFFQTGHKKSVALTEDQVRKYRTIMESLYDVHGLRLRIKEWAELRRPTTGTVLEQGGEPAVSRNTPSRDRNSKGFF